MAQISFANFHIVLCMGALATLAPIKDVQIEEYYNKLGPNRNEYSFRYRLSDGQTRYEKGCLSSHRFFVSGSYQYVGPDHLLNIVYYTADENGFHTRIVSHKELFKNPAPGWGRFGVIRYG